MQIDEYKNKAPSFFINTLIVISSGFFIKVLGVINKIAITRLLGTSGMSLYILAFPTILLFINLSSFSLNISTSKLVAENMKNQQLSPNKIIKKSIKITLIISFFLIIVFLITLKPLISKLLRNENLYWPLLTTVFLIPLVGISDTLKGYFNGLKKMSISATAQIIEQTFRIVFSITFLYLMAPFGIITATSFALLALSIGEIFSIIYCLYKYRKLPPIDFPSKGNETKAILKIALPTTGSRLIGSITYFLEPIIYNSFLIYVGVSELNIQTQYTIINAYAIPLLTTASFLSVGIATTLIPSISENYVLKNYKTTTYYIKKSFIFSLIPGFLVSILLFFYPKEFMQLIYNTNEGVEYIRRFVFIFFIYYLQAPCVAILQAMGKARLVFVISSVLNVLRILLIGGLSLIKSIRTDSIFYAIMLTAILSTLILVVIVIRLTKLRINFKLSYDIIIIGWSTLIFSFLITNLFNLHFLINTSIITIIYLILCYKFKLLDIKSLKRKKLIKSD